MTELHNGWTSRERVRRDLEERLDTLAPQAERAKTWGRQMSPAELERLRGKKKR